MTRWWIVLSILGVTLGGLLIVYGRPFLFPGAPSRYLWLGLCAFPFILLQAILPGILQGLQEFGRLNFVTLVPLTVNLTITICAFAALRDDVAAALLGFWCGAFFGSLALLWQVRLALRGAATRGTPQAPSTDNSGLSTQRLLGYSGTAHASNVVTFANYRADFYIVSQLLGAGPAGVYTTAVQLAERLWIVAQSVSYVLLPHLAAQEDEAQMQRRMMGALKGTVIATGLLCVAMGVLIEPLVAFFLGPGYQDSAVVLIWLLPGILLGSVSKILSNTLAARGRVDINLLTACIIFVCNVVLSVWLTRAKGPTGAALATSLSYVLDGLIKIATVQWLFGFHERPQPGSQDLNSKRVTREMK